MSEVAVVNVAVVEFHGVEHGFAWSMNAMVAEIEGRPWRRSPSTPVDHRRGGAGASAASLMPSALSRRFGPTRQIGPTSPKAPLNPDENYHHVSVFQFSTA